MPPHLNTPAVPLRPRTILLYPTIYRPACQRPQNTPHRKTLPDRCIPQRLLHPKRPRLHTHLLRRGFNAITMDPIPRSPSPLKCQHQLNNPHPQKPDPHMVCYVEFQGNQTPPHTTRIPSTNSTPSTIRPRTLPQRPSREVVNP